MTGTRAREDSKPIAALVSNAGIQLGWGLASEQREQVVIVDEDHGYAPYWSVRSGSSPAMRAMASA